MSICCWEAKHQEVGKINTQADKLPGVSRVETMRAKFKGLVRELIIGF